jgi:hypothetical protein
MGLLKITNKEIEKAKRPEEGWYLAEVVEVEEKLAKPKANKPQGMNSVHTLQLMEYVDNGKHVSVEELEKEKQVYIPLGDVNKSFVFPYIEAVQEKPIEELADVDLDLEKDFKGKKLYVHVTHTIYKKNETDKGQPSWEIDTYQPASQVPF